MISEECWGGQGYGKGSRLWGLPTWPLVLEFLLENELEVSSI